MNIDDYRCYPDRLNPSELRFAKISADRTHGATYLARNALTLLDDLPREEWSTMGRRLTNARPEMPLIANVVQLAVQGGDAKAVLNKLRLERRRLTERAAEALRGYRSVITISNSSAVVDALKASAIRSVKVVVAGPGDEGCAVVRTLRRAGRFAEAVSPSDSEADIGLVGCDAVFEDGSFVNRRGTVDLAQRLKPRVLLVLVESLKRVEGKTPRTWPEPAIFEIVRPAANIQVLLFD